MTTQEINGTPCRLLTPRTREGRVRVWLNPADYRAFRALPREWGVSPVEVVDQESGVYWWVRPAGCGAPCFCDAFASRDPLEAAALTPDEQDEKAEQEAET